MSDDIVKNATSAAKVTPLPQYLWRTSEKCDIQGKVAPPPQYLWQTGKKCCSLSSRVAFFA
jgi:hypothetical protein